MELGNHSSHTLFWYWHLHTQAMYEPVMRWWWFVVLALPWAPCCCPTASLRQSEQMQEGSTVSGNEKEANCFLKPNYHLKTAAASCEPFCFGLLGRQQVLVGDTETGSSKRLALGRLDSTFQEAYRGKLLHIPF